MLKRLLVASFLALCLVQPAMADSITLIPSLDQIHIVQAIFPNQPEACNKAQKAFVMQTGIEKDYNVIRDNANHKISIIGDKAAKTAENFIDEQTPLNSKTIAIAGAVAYTVAVTKTYTQNLGDPLIRGMHQSLTVGQDKIATGITYSF